ncbi:hypothetical protein pb186bvf_005869 [Paramecium bursaria]
MKNLSGGGFGNRPKSLKCQICGREFGTQSLEIHQKTCIKKYQNELNSMDSYHKKTMLSPNQLMAQIQQEKERSLKPKNKQQFQEQETTFVALAQCRRCGRKFNPDRIRKHESVCIGPEPDVSAIKKKQFEINRREAKRLRPKKTGKWREQHLEFQQALKEMRKLGSSKVSYGRAPPSQNQFQNKQYNKQQIQQNRIQGQRYPQTQQVTHKVPEKRINTPQQRQQMNQYKQPERSYAQPTRSSGGGGPSYQIATSNVSTFSLFTSDGLPKNYDKYQSSNPYAKKGVF